MEIEDIVINLPFPDPGEVVWVLLAIAAIILVVRWYLGIYGKVVP